MARTGTTTGNDEQFSQTESRHKGRYFHNSKIQQISARWVNDSTKPPRYDAEEVSRMIRINAKGETNITICKRGVIPKGITALSDADIGKPSQFCVHLNRHNLGIVEAVIQVLRDFAQREVV
jgi:hypothetical protein